MAGTEQYTIRRQVFTLFGAGFFILDASGREIGYCRQKAFRIREDLRVFTDRSRTTELLRITTPHVFDISSRYDVKDPSGQVLGSVLRRGLKSLARDEWKIMNQDGAEVATILEDSAFKALVRRFLEIASLLMPQSYHVTSAGGQPVAAFRSHFNPFIRKVGVAVYDGAAQAGLEPRVILAAAILITAIEGRQS